MDDVKIRDVYTLDEATAICYQYGLLLDRIETMIRKEVGFPNRVVKGLKLGKRGKPTAPATFYRKLREKSFTFKEMKEVLRVLEFLKAKK